MSLLLSHTYDLISYLLTFGQFSACLILQTCCLYLVDWRIVGYFISFCVYWFSCKENLSLAKAKLYCCYSIVFHLHFYIVSEFKGPCLACGRLGKQCKKRIFLWEIFLPEYFFQNSHLIWETCSKDLLSS